MKDTIKYGVIGVGNQGTAYVLDFFDQGKIKNAVVSAICDVNPSKIQNIKDKTINKDIVYFDDYKKMLDSGLCDAILVEVPHYQHPEIVIECLNRGIHVICEKPAGVYTKQVREMNEVAQKSGAHFAMMFNQRTNCVYRKMKEIIASGGIGEVMRVNWIITNWFRTQKYYDSGSWRATWAGEGGGVLINQCPHQIDLVQWIVGKMPVKVNGFCKYGKWHDIEVEDEVTAYFEYDNGATGVFITTTGEFPGTNRLEVSGSKGKLLVDDNSNELIWYKLDEDLQDFSKNATTGFASPNYEKIIVETDGLNEQHAGIMTNFARALLGLEDFFVDGVEGINGVELMNAIELSGWKGGQPVTLPVNEEEYLEELNKRRSKSRVKVVDDGYIEPTIGTYGVNNKK